MRIDFEVTAMESSTSGNNMSNSDCVTSSLPSMSTAQESSTSLNAFFYIVVVLSFYAFAMVVLMVMYVRREQQEAMLSLNFDEFISRDRFNTPQFRNQQELQAVLRTLRSLSQKEAEMDPEDRMTSTDAAASSSSAVVFNIDEILFSFSLAQFPCKTIISRMSK
ncbi:hypothetical protein CAPTEDRAFT_199433 [Capitella teleta]|uniref:Uncharacterized protein n=1 Tax=Capitella teleta TaxID=283909 RepID=R7VI24_CAPTE|nr:hypothetical protein CAPTEDRAFT_199433 [Capitella teleta]|eukprot:ELU15360.1 hypothetical protein CAPTEDRAFT_199433 [Capitella teleta]